MKIKLYLVVLCTAVIMIGRASGQQAVGRNGLTTVSLNECISDFLTGDTPKWFRAAREMGTYYEQGNPTEKLRVVEVVLNTLSAPAEPGEPWDDDNTKRNQMCVLAGEEKIIEAVPELIKLLRLKPGQRYTGRVSHDWPLIEDGELIGFPALSLSNIGKGALPELYKEQRLNRNHTVQINIRWILRTMHSNGLDR